MPGLQIITTKAGRAALVNAEHNGTAPLKIAEIGITAAVFNANEDMIALPGEFKRLSTIAGEVVAPDTMHVTIRDDGSDTYTVRGIGYWLSNGVLLGLYSQPDPILQKSTQSMMLLAADTVFTTITATSLTFGDANFTNPPATFDRQGVVELATLDETAAGKDATRAVTPAGLTPAMAKAIAAHMAASDPHQQYLTPERGNALYFRKLPAVTSSDTDCDTLLETGVRDVSVANDRGVIAATKLPAGADGYGSLTTVNGGQFVHQVYTEATIAHRTWQRTGFLGTNRPFEGHNWKLLWDSATFDPGTKQDKLAYIPVQQGTGIGQTPNTVKIGWSNGSGVKVTVDASDMGSVVFAQQRTKLNWNGIGGQPTWIYGGNTPDDVNVYNPSNFSVNYANSANYASTAGVANTWQGFPLRFAENPPGNLPYYLLGIEAGHNEFSIYNRTALSVGSAMSAVYANQLTGQGLQHGGIGGYHVNKNHTSPELGGAWELRGFAYDFGSGGDGGMGTRTALWQRVA
ncbi:hypothetical protein [Collimonas sp. OK412]|uniref:hypothetical protein n=1 Tax=Collimonas sp. (strain OK412) TaxID=1801619 RepID=UPI0008E988A7|nr:hypothetical protein [Collimonas sp. OK412]SFD28439.1 hypothetical protein SAMN04515619_13620 [Collimonas sp. OK412]